MVKVKMRDESPLDGMRRHSFMTKIVQTRRRSTSSSRRHAQDDPGEDVVLLRREQGLANGEESWDAPWVKNKDGAVEELSKIRSETESVLQSNKVLQANYEYSMEADKLPEKRRTKSWKKIARPLLASWQKLNEDSSTDGSETAPFAADEEDSFDVDCFSHSSGDAKTEKTQDETFDSSVDDLNEFLQQGGEEAFIDKAFSSTAMKEQHPGTAVPQVGDSHLPVHRADTPVRRGGTGTGDTNKKTTNHRTLHAAVQEISESSQNQCQETNPVKILPMMDKPVPNTHAVRVPVSVREWNMQTDQGIYDGEHVYTATSHPGERTQKSNPGKNSGKQGPIYSEPLDEFESEPTPAPYGPKVVGSQQEWKSVVSTFMEAISMSFDELKKEKSDVSGERPESTVVDSFQKGRETLSSPKPSPSAFDAFEDSFAVHIESVPNFRFSQESSGGKRAARVVPTIGAISDPSSRKKLKSSDHKVFPKTSPEMSVAQESDNGEQTACADLSAKQTSGPSSSYKLNSSARKVLPKAIDALPSPQKASAIHKKRLERAARPVSIVKETSGSSSPNQTKSSSRITVKTINAFQNHQAMSVARESDRGERAACATSFDNQASDPSSPNKPNSSARKVLPKTFDALPGPTMVSAIHKKGMERAARSSSIVTRSTNSSSPDKPKCSAPNVIPKITKPMPTVLTGANLRPISRSDSKDTANYSHDSVWDDVEVKQKNVEVKPKTVDEWINFGDESGGMKTGTERGDVGLFMDPLYPDDELNNIEASQATSRIGMDNPCGPSRHSATDMPKHFTRGAPLMTPTSSDGLCSVESSEESARAKRVSRMKARVTNARSFEVHSRVEGKLEKLKEDCYGLLCIFLEVTVDACQAAVVVGNCVLVGVSDTCCSGAKQEDVDAPTRTAPRSKGERTRSPINVVTQENGPILSRNESDDSVPDLLLNGASRCPVVDEELTNPSSGHRALVTSPTPDYIDPPDAVLDEAALSGRATRIERVNTDETLLSDVDRFMIAMQPIKECQQQVREARSDEMRSRQEITRDEWFWRQHEAKWRARLPTFTGGDAVVANK